MDHFISLAQAVEMTTTFRENRDKILATNYQGTTFLPNAETFDRAAFDAVLSQLGCEQLRIYYGMDSELKVHAIIVGVNAQNEDILPVTGDATDDGSTGIIEVGQRCPPDCGTGSPLNG